MAKKRTVLKRIPAVKGLPQQILEQLEQRILNGELKEGDKLPTEHELAEQAGVGRRAIREGLQALELKGLVEIRRGSGTYVRRNDMESYLESLLANIHAYLANDRAQLLHVIQFRKIISSYAVEQLARTPSSETVKSLERRMRQQQAAFEQQNPGQYHNAHLAFHLEVVESLMNPIITMLYAPVLRLILKTMRESGSHLDIMKNNIKEHRDILRAIKRGDVEGARQAIYKHLETGLKNLAEEQQAKKPMASPA